MKKLFSIVVSFVMVFTLLTGAELTIKASENVTVIRVNNVVEPTVGTTIGQLNYATVSNDAEYNFFGSDYIYWFDLDSAKPEAALPKDTKCVQGHRYKVSIRLMVKGGYSFAANCEGKINGKDASTSGYLGRSKSTNLAVEYTFPVCDYKQIAEVQLSGAGLTSGTELTNTWFTPTTPGVMKQTACSFTRNGETVAWGEKVTYGNYGVKILIAPEENYRFGYGVVVKYNGKVFPKVTRIGNGIYAESADDLFQVNCTHEYGDYSYDATTHWKACSHCGDKMNIEPHSFGAGVKVGDVTTYTCSKCGYQKIQKYVENGFRYGDVEGGVQIIAYNGDATNVVIPSEINGKKVVSIADYAFTYYSNRTSFKSITVPNTVTSIGSGAFDGCTALTSVNIPEKIKRIEAETFYDCESLESISIPFGVEFIGENAFAYCEKLADIVIPCSVKTIGASAFRQCTTLDKVVVPDSVSKLGTGVFLSCSGMNWVELGSGINSIPQSTFSGCTGLDYVVVPKSITMVENYAFSKAVLNSVYYRGSSSEWNNIDIISSDDKNKVFANAAKIYDYANKTDVGQHKYSVFQTVEADCIHEGFTLNVCEGCGDSFKTNVTECTGIHSYNSGTFIIEPTCTEDGVKSYVCNVCGHSYEEDVFSTGHHWDEGVVTKKATTTKTGLKKFTCSVCGKTKTETIEKVKKPKATKIVSVKATKKTLKVKWKKVSGVTGYKIQYSTTKKFKKKATKTKTVKGAKKTTVKLKRLKKKKVYYVRICTYKKSGKPETVSKWSKAKRKKTK